MNNPIEKWATKWLFIYEIIQIWGKKTLNRTSNSEICKLKWKCKWITQSCPTLCDPMDCSPPGSSVYGILQARVLEWVAISFSRGSSRPRDQTAGRLFTDWKNIKQKLRLRFANWGLGLLINMIVLEY